MGRQINYYMDEKTENEFIEYIFSRDFLIISEDLKNQRILIYNNINEVDYKQNRLYIYKRGFENIITNHNCDYKIDSIESSVIQFVKTSIRNEEKEISRGRLWFESKYYGKDGEIIFKNPLLTKEYESLVRWIKKHTTYQEVNHNGYMIKDYVTNSMKKLSDEGYRFM